MKKGFSLIETMIAIVVIMIGFSAVVSMSLSAISNSGSSKAKLKATSIAQGILEKYRAERDLSGLAMLSPFPTPAATVVDGITYTPLTTVYALDQNSALVETTVSWFYKRNESVKNYILLTNYANRATLAPPYTKPTWYVSPTMYPTPTPTPTATGNTPTPINTPTPAPCPGGGTQNCSSYGCKCQYTQCIGGSCVWVDGDRSNGCVIGLSCSYYY